MFRTFEKYLEQIGERRGMLLLAAILVWASILLAIYAYGIGMGILAAGRISRDAYEAIREIAADRAYGGDRWSIFMAAVVWLLLIVLIFPLRAAGRIWRGYRLEQRQAQKALSAVEERLFEPAERSSDAHDPRERLARRALDEIETRLQGTPQPADLTIEERLIKLEE